MQQQNGAHYNSKFCLSCSSLRDNWESVEDISWSLIPKVLEKVWFSGRSPQQCLFKGARPAHPSCLVWLVPFQAWQIPVHVVWIRVRHSARLGQHRAESEQGQASAGTCSARPQGGFLHPTDPSHRKGTHGSHAAMALPPPSQHHPGDSFASAEGIICPSSHLNPNLHSNSVNIFDAAS